MADYTLTTGRREGGAVPEAADRLRRFCSAVLQLLDEEAFGPATAAELAQAIGAGTQAVADGLRGDLCSCEAAIEQLGVLARSRYLQPAREVVGMCAELEGTRERGRRLLDALEALHEGAAPVRNLPQTLEHSTPAKEEADGRPSVWPERPGQNGSGRESGQQAAFQYAPAEPRVDRPIPAPSETAVHEVTATLPVLPPRAHGPASVLRPDATDTQPAAGRPAAGDKPAGRATTADDRMEVSCPRCGHAGVIGWGRLNKVINCPACSKHFSVRPNGVTTEVICTADGRWVEARARQPARTERTYRRLLVVLTLVAVLVPAASALAWRATRSPNHSAETELPRDLQPRAELFAKAWLRNDLPLMRQLTTPTHDRVLYSWYTRHRPPTAPDGPPPDVRVEVKTLPAAGGMTLVRSRVSATGLSTERGPVELALHWEERDGNWFCVPPNK